MDVSVRRSVDAIVLCRGFVFRYFETYSILTSVSPQRRIQTDVQMAKASTSTDTGECRCVCVDRRQLIVILSRTTERLSQGRQSGVHPTPIPSIIPSNRS